MTNFNDELSEWVDYKCEQAKLLRDARKAELAAHWEKIRSDIRLEYQMSLARAKKL